MQQTTYKELSIANHNNKLATECFIVIDKSPGKENVPTRYKVESRLYAAKYNNETVFVKIIDLLFVPFGKLTDHFTFWANGKNYDEFKADWLQQHPRTTDETEMIIYYYKRAEEKSLSVIS
jgi:hypothetical protein